MSLKNKRHFIRTGAGEGSPVDEKQKLPTIFNIISKNPCSS